MVLEYIPEGDLDKFLRKPLQTLETFSPRFRLIMAREIALGMQSLHNQVPPIIHRDLRSPNIFICSKNEKDSIHLKVADFGLARFVTPNVSGTLDTWRWLAPEVIGVTDKTAGRNSSNNYGCPSDVYSFAICCWEIVTCGHPFEEFQTDVRFCRMDESGKGHVSITKLKQAIFTENLRPTLPDSETCKLPDEFLDLIRKCWSTLPSDRPNFNQVVAKLDAIILSHIAESDNDEKLALEFIKEAEESRLQLMRPRRKTISKSTTFISSNGLYLSAIPSLESIILEENTRENDIDYNKEVAANKTIRLPMRLKVSCACFREHDELENQIWIGTESGVVIVLDADNDLNVVTLWNAQDSTITSITIVGDEVWCGSSEGIISIWNTKVKKYLLF